MRSRVAGSENVVFRSTSGSVSNIVLSVFLSFCVLFVSQSLFDGFLGPDDFAQCCSSNRANRNSYHGFAKCYHNENSNVFVESDDLACKM